MRSSTSKVVTSLLMLLMMITTSISPSACGPTVIYMGGNREVLNVSEKAEVCVDVNKKYLPEVLDAIYAWDSAIRNWKHLVPRLGPDFDDCNYMIKEVDPDDDTGPRTLGATSRLFGREIKLYRGRYEIDPLSITLHEIGHALGARHMPGTMMNDEIIYFKYRCPDAATVAQVAIANGIDPSTLSWCRQSF